MHIIWSQAQTKLFLDLFSFIKYLLKSSDHNQSLMQQLDDPKSQPQSKSSPDFCTEFWKIQTSIPVFCDFNSVIKWKSYEWKVVRQCLLTDFKPRNLFLQINVKCSQIRYRDGIPTCVLKHGFKHGESISPLAKSRALSL